MGTYTVLASGVKTTNYVDSTAKNSTTYYYVVAAVNANGVASAYSNQIMTIPFAPAQPPTGVIATAGKASVSLSWNKVSGALWYYIERSTVSGGPYGIVGYPMTNSFKDISVKSGIKYYYVIMTYVNVAGMGSISANSAQVSAQPS
jgi:fibronectin type 3 domain-containing protein